MTIKAKTLFATLATAAAVAAIAAPAAAQSYGNDRGDHGRYEQGRYEQGRYEQGRYDNDRVGHGWMSERAQTADRRIDQGLRSGEFTRAEHARLSAELNRIVRFESQARRNGLTSRERVQIDRNYDRLIQDIRLAGNDRDHRQYGAGYRR